MGLNKAAAIVLAAGEGTRMKSKKPKVAHEILGRPLVEWVLNAAIDAEIESIVTVVGHKADEVIPLVEGKSSVAIQEEQLGTADAVKSGLLSDALQGFNGSIVVLSGDCPLITAKTIKDMVDTKASTGASCVVLTMAMDDPFGYGRIIREDTFAEDTPSKVNPECTGEVLRIVEQKDATDIEAAVCECNSGFYCFDADALKAALAKVDSNNAQGEYYLTDVLEEMKNAGLKCIALRAEDPLECLGVNSRRQLAYASHVMQARINGRLMDEGVTMVAPELVWCGPDVHIDRDVTLLPNVVLSGKTTIGEDSVIGPNTRLFDTTVGCGCVLEETIAYEAILEDEATSGPRAYLRPGAHLCKSAKAGCHVEIKKSTVGVGSKVPHLSYIGDATIGTGVNIGAGSITCNYDGEKKHPTEIGDRVFVGSDTMMVAPVSIGADATIGAGSVITKNIPEGCLAVARARERIIEGWSKKKHIK